MAYLASGPHDGAVSDFEVDWAFDSPSTEVLLAHPDGVIAGALGENHTVEISLGAWSSATSFFSLGIDHIRGGTDHMMFLLVLTLAVAGASVTRGTSWRTVKLVTAFTIGHAISLGLADFDLIGLAWTATRLTGVQILTVGPQRVQSFPEIAGRSTKVPYRAGTRNLHAVHVQVISPSTHVSTAVVQLADQLLVLDSVDLDQLDRAQLHDRVESKVILRTDELPAAIDVLAEDYVVLEHLGDRVQGYCNTYFDSPQLRNYHEHHNQLGRRLKLRYRTYENSDLTFFEVKRSVGGRTVKERRRSLRPGRVLHPDDAAFFAERTGWDPAALSPSLTVDYRRILLVKRDFSERVTIDFDVRFHTDRGATTPRGLAICEFKQPRLDRRSPAMAAMKRRPQKFSKYCVGLASCDPSLRRNRFKKVFLNLDTLGTTPVASNWPPPSGPLCAPLLVSEVGS